MTKYILLGGSIAVVALAAGFSSRSHPLTLTEAVAACQSSARSGTSNDAFVGHDGQNKQYICYTASGQERWKRPARD